MRTFSPESPDGAVDDPRVGFVQTPRLQHLPLVLNQQLDALYRRRRRLGDDGRRPRQDKVLCEPEQRARGRLLAHLRQAGQRAAASHKRFLYERT